MNKNEQNLNNAEPQLNIPIISCWVVVLNYTTGFESDAKSTEIKAVFMSKKEADDYCNVLFNIIKWSNYYEGYLDVEEVPFKSCLMRKTI